MRALVIGLILLALVAAGGTAYLARQFIASTPQEPTTTVTVAAPEPTRVLVASQNMPAGAVVSQSSFAWNPWPEDAIEPDYVRSEAGGTNRADLEAQFIDTVVRHGIPEGAPLTAAMVFRRNNVGILAGVLSPGKRAMAVPVSAVSAAAGFVLPGDHIDIMLTHDVRRDLPSNSTTGPVIANSLIRYTSETIFRDMKVLAVDQSLQDLGEGAVVARTITLEVTTSEAEALNVALVLGQLSVVLRSLSVDESVGQVGTFTTDLQVSPTLAYAFQSMNAAAQQALRDAEAANARSETDATARDVNTVPEVSGPRVKVYRGGSSSTREFN
jgi:pilus assembly protein CpaB